MKSTTIILTALILAVIAGCAKKTPIRNSGLVAPEGHAPYYTTLADAQVAAVEGQPIAVEFYTDW